MRYVLVNLIRMKCYATYIFNEKAPKYSIKYILVQNQFN